MVWGPTPSLVLNYALVYTEKKKLYHSPLTRVASKHYPQVLGPTSVVKPLWIKIKHNKLIILIIV